MAKRKECRRGDLRITSVVPGEFVWAAKDMAHGAWWDYPRRLERALRAGAMLQGLVADERMVAAAILVGIHHFPHRYCMRDLNKDFDRAVSPTCTRMRDLVLYGSGDKPTGKWNPKIRGKNSKPVVFQKQVTDAEVATVRLASLIAAHDVGEPVDLASELPKLKVGHPVLVERATRIVEGG